MIEWFIFFDGYILYIFILMCIIFWNVLFNFIDFVLFELWIYGIWIFNFFVVLIVFLNKFVCIFVYDLLILFVVE